MCVCVCVRVFVCVYLISNALRCSNFNWKTKVVVISESIDLSTMDLCIMLDKLQEHDIKLD